MLVPYRLSSGTKSGVRKSLQRQSGAVQVKRKSDWKKNIECDAMDAWDLFFAIELAEKKNERDVSFVDDSHFFFAVVVKATSASKQR